MRSKKESPAWQQGQLFEPVKGKHSFRNGKTCLVGSDTQQDAYCSITELRATELKRGRLFFQNNPAGEYSRADLCEHLGLPINHVTRIAYELIDTGVVEVVGKGLNPRSGITVQKLRLAGKEGLS